MLSQRDSQARRGHGDRVEAASDGRGHVRARKQTTRNPEGWEVFYRVVRKIPRGRVLTYGAVAERAGRPRSARHVGFALAALRDTNRMRGVPWQRVLGSRGGGFAAVAIRDPIGGALQRELLERESVEFDERGRVDLARFGWKSRVKK